MTTELQKAILRTLVYADIFDYPLTAKEIWRWLIGNSKPQGKIRAAGKAFGDARQKLVQEGKIQKLTGFYFLKNRKETVVLRKNRDKWSQKKLKIAKGLAKWLKLIPTIKMVAITGALAMNNADKDEDIDILVVTKKGRLWLTRFLTVFLIESVAKRRHPGDEEIKDKICLNMFLDEKHLGVPKKEQNLFTAHEVCQLRPLWDRNEIYQKFIKENQWLKHFLPNWKL